MFSLSNTIYQIFCYSYVSAHVRTGSADSALDWSLNETSEANVNCIHVSTARAHQQPITVLECEGGRVVTGSQDHTLKVFYIKPFLY